MGTTASFSPRARARGVFPHFHRKGAFAPHLAAILCARRQGGSPPTRTIFGKVEGPLLEEAEQLDVLNHLPDDKRHCSC